MTTRPTFCERSIPSRSVLAKVSHVVLSSTGSPAPGVQLPPRRSLHVRIAVSPAIANHDDGRLGGASPAEKALEPAGQRFGACDRIARVEHVLLQVDQE